MAYTLPQGDPSNPALPSPIFGDVSAARGDHLRANNNFIWQDLEALAALFDPSGNALASLSSLITYIASGDVHTVVEAAFVADRKLSFRFAPGCTNMPTPAGWFIDVSYGTNANSIKLTAYVNKLKNMYVQNRVEGVWDADWAMITNQNGNPPSAAYDLIIDSDAKLAAWAASGTYARVLIKAGTWTLAAGGVNLTAAGTKEVIAETGSLLVFRDVAGALYYSSVPTTNEYRMTGVNVSVTGLVAASTSFFKCANLYNCTATVSGTAYTNRGFYQCFNLTGCIATVGGTTVLSSGFYACNYLRSCTSTVTTTTGGATAYNLGNNLSHCVANANTTTGTATGFSSIDKIESCVSTSVASSNGTAYGFSSCTKVSNSAASASNGGASPAYGFSSCYSLVSCQGSGSAGTTGAGFDNCTQVTGCLGVGTGSTGYGFDGCKKVVNNTTGTCTTAKYTASYADAGTAAACADTAAGGWNS